MNNSILGISVFRYLLKNSVLTSFCVFFLLSCKPSEVTVHSSAYKITSKSNVNRVQISKTGDTENQIEIIIRSRGQMTSSGPQNIQLQGSSGIEENRSFLGFTDVSFPFRGTISFDYVKQAHDATGTTAGEMESLATSTRANMSFEINELGRWRVNLYY